MPQSKSIKQRIFDLPKEARSALAIAVARRLMDDYLELPELTRPPFSGTLADVVSKLEKAITGHSDELNRELDASLKEYYAGPYYHELREDALPGADEDAASATIYAIQSYCTHNKEAAGFAATQLLDATFSRADAIYVAEGIEAMSKEADEVRSQLEQIELDRLDRAVSLLEHEGLTEHTMSSLGTILRG